MASHTCSSFLSLNSSSSSSQLAKINPITHTFLLPPTLIHLSSSQKNRPSMNMHIHKHDARTTLTNNVVRSVLTSNNAAETASDRVQQVHSTDEFDEALRNAKNRLVVVEYAATRVPDSKALYPFMVSLSKTCADVDFLLVMGDESEKTRALCEREKVFKVPHFTFYKNMEKVHEEDAITAGQLADDVLYYGDRETQVRQLHNRGDVEALIATHKEDDKLIVLDVGLKHCGPCVKVYPTVVKLARQMVDSVVFARMNGDENDSCMEFLKNMDVVQVPTFLFIREGEIKGRYVGSGKGELIGEILRYQGVRVTY